MQQFSLKSSVVLMGYAGSGKSTVGRLLAQKLAIRHQDLDTFIEEKQQQSITDLFKNRGEIYFRKIENQLLVELLNAGSPLVISLGGGTPCYGNNAELIANSQHLSFYLQANVPTLVARLSNEKQQRPLLAAVEDLPTYIGQHLFEREHYYRTAKHIVSTTGKTPEEVADEIYRFLT
ncbi:shikimate kinase [Flavobacterium sp.]|uniref:shikimate kinase n=1 Tax=Flavobacterium sp. TaxID=239 RepID=UPI00261697E0|nr:shikimate kinase [Flavobacterium sp.]